MVRIFQVLISALFILSVLAILLALRDSLYFGRNVMRLRHLVLRWLEAVSISTMTVLMAIGFGREKEFLVGWLIAFGLILVVLILAVIDVGMTLRSHGEQAKRLVRDFTESMKDTLTQKPPPDKRENDGGQPRVDSQ